MTSYSDLLGSIFAMDAYNRDNNQGIFHSNAGVNDDSLNLELAGYRVINSIRNEGTSFYAIAYQKIGTNEVIISYRGTDDFTGLLSNDVVKGWAIGAGITGPNQLADAIAFYEEVLNSVQGTTGLTVYNRAPANFTLVGHSLGGGLAGVVASLSGANAFVTDTMPYTIAAWTAYFDGVLKAIGESPAISALLGVSGATALARYTQLPSALTGLTQATVSNALNQLKLEGKMPTPPDWSKVKGVHVDGEVMEFLRDGSLTLGPAILTALIPGAGPLSVLFSAYTALFAVGTGTTNQRELNTVGWTFDDQGSLINKAKETLDRHSGALPVILQYGEYKQNTEWTSNASAFSAMLNALYRDDVGSAIGLKQQPKESNGEPGAPRAGFTGFVGPADQMTRMIAYSAIESGFRPFGDTGIKAYLNDATDLARALKSAGSKTAESYARPLAEFATQFAGQLAFNKVLSSAKPNAANGVLTLTPGTGILVIDLSSTTWVNATGKMPTKFAGWDSFIELNTVKSASFSTFASAFVFGTSEFKAPNRIAFNLSTTAVSVILPTPSSASLAAGDVTVYVGADGNDTITGSIGNDFIVGGFGNDILKGGGGNNILSGGLGDDTLFAGPGKDILSGGAGFDTVSFDLSSPVDVVVGNIGLTSSQRTVLLEIERINLTNSSDTVTVQDWIGVAAGTILDGLGHIATGIGDTLSFLGNTAGLFVDEAGRARENGLIPMLRDLFNNPFESYFGRTTDLTYRNFETIRGSYQNDKYLDRTNPNVDVYLEGGNDYAISSGQRIYGGAGSDAIGGIGQRVQLFGGDGVTTDNVADIFVMGNNSFAMDATAHDYVSWGLPFFRVTGGTQLAWQEDGYAYWQPLSSITALGGLTSAIGGGILSTAFALFDVATALTFRFSLTVTNQLVIEFGRGRGGTAVIENYNLNLETGAATGNVVVFKQEYSDKGTIDTLTQYLNLALRAGFGLCTIGTDPIVIDLDGDGLDLTSGVTTYFDLNADGFAEKAAWVKGDDGFLVRDLNNNGKIDNIGEMFGTATTPGHTALKALDTNNDNRLTSADTAFASLRVWQDLNGNGVTDAGELKTLSQLGITSIATTGAAPTTANVRGNTIRAESNVTFANGTTRKAVDVMLNSNPADTKWLGSTTVSAAAAALPELKGYGTIADLRVKMTTDATLLTRVDAVAKMAATSTWTQILGLTDDVLFRWAGVDGVAATAMGTGFDRQKLAFLEKYLGTQLTPRDAAGVPSLNNLTDLIKTWDKVLADTAARLAVQGPLKTVFSGFTFDKGSDELRATSATSLSDTFVKIFAQLSTVSATAQTQWNTSWAPLLTAFVDAAVRADTNAVRSDFVVASLMRAMDGRTNALTLKNFVDGLALQNVKFGGSGNDNLTRTGDGMVIMVGDAGNDNYDGSGGQTVYVFGKGFGQDVITDVDAGAFGDRIRFAVLNDNQVTLTRSGVDLLIKVNGTTDQILVRNQFVDLKNGIEEIQFANGKIFTSGEIAAAVGKGTSASETLVGSALNDELEGLGGNDVLQGGDGGDLYYFSRGHGQDRIEDNQTTPLNQSADTLLIENGYTLDDAILTRTGNSNDLVLTFKGTTDKITIVGQFFYNSLGIRGGEQTVGMVGDFLNTGFFGGNKLALDSRIEGIFFKSGGGWSWGDIQTKLIAQATTKGNDVVWGFGTADVFYASSGNDLLQGRDGSDTYHFARGAGQDTIFDQAEFVTIASNDTVKLIGGLKKTDITLSRVANTNDLLIKIVGTTDTLTIKEQFGGRKIDLFGFFDVQWNNRVEEFLFDDGTKYTWTDILALLTQGTAGNDTLVGDFNVDTLDGKAGNDFLDGGDMGDIYLFGKGDGKDIIHDRPSWVIDSGVDTVKFKTGVTFAETKFLLDRLTGDLVITFVGTPDELRVKGHFNLTQAGPFGELATNRIEQFQWADGTKKTWADISAAAVAAQATAGNDTIAGTQGNDRIDGGLGNDRLLGGDGSDTYVFGSGKGNDTISDFLNNILSGNADVVEFGAGITLANLKLDRIGTNLNDLRITLATGETLTIEGQFAFNSLGWSANQIETFKFADGTTLSATGLQQTLLTRQGTAGADTITGFATNDTLIGGAGNDILRGGEGSDTYRFAPGFGVDVIEEASGNILDSDFDVVQFETGITAANARVSRSGDDLIFSFTGSTDSLRIKGQFTPFAFFGAFNDIEQFRFADGTVWSDADVRARVLSQAKTNGNDTIIGFFTADTLDGGAGNDILRGSSGSDTYVFGKGYGQDQIQESVDHHPFLDGTDTLAFNSSVLKTDVRFSQVGTDLVATILSTGEAIRVVGHFSNANARIELVTFADGTKLSREQFETNALAGAGTSGDDTITGSNANNVLDGGAGNDILRGGDGDDTYIFGRGYGQDIVDEATGWDGEYDDKIVFGAGISLNNLVTTRSGNDLIIRIAGTTDQLTVWGQFSSTNSGSVFGTQRIEKFVFADGSVLTGADIDLRILQSLKTSGADTVQGYDSSDIIDGGAGNDMLIGGDGNDTYYFGRGYGSDTVSENSGALGELDDRIQFTSSVRPADLLLSRDGNSLIIKIKNTTDQLTVVGQFSSTNSDWVFGNYRIEKFCFANGLIWTAADIDRMVLEAMKTAGADTVIGYDGDEVIDGGAGNDTLIGGEGNDTYVWGRGYGSDIVNENSGAWGELDDKIRFAPGVNPSDLLLSRDGNTLIIKIKNTTDQLSILGQFTSTYSDGLWGNYRIERFLFSNGTIWSAAEIDVMMIQAAQTSGNDTIMGYDGHERLDGGAGNDTLAGYRGDDTYVFGRGYGQDYIDESSGSYDDANDVVLFKEGIAPTDLLLSKNGTSLIIRIAGTTDQLTIAHQLWNSSINGGAGNRIERFVFANGLVWTADEVDLRVLQAQQTTGNDVVSGYDGNDVLDGGRGNDTLMAARGNDTYVFGRGYGQDRVDDWAGNYGDIDDIILFRADIAPADLLLSRSGLDLVIKIAGTTDQLTIINQFFTSILVGYASGNRIERFVFANGVVWTASEIDQRVLLSQQTAGNDEVKGYDINDVLDGGLGNDTLFGYFGEDTYIFGRGYGNDIVNEATGVFGGPNDTVRFLSGISASDLQVSYSGGNLVIRITGTTDTLTIINQNNYYEGGGNRIERFVFADGSVLSAVEMDVMVLRGEAGAIFGTVNADTYNGTANADLYFGEAGNDTINGNAGNDTLSGVAGNDTLNGGEGSDILVGGAGNDVFVLSTNVGGEYDYLLGGNGVDTVNLSGFVSAIEFRLDDARNEIYTRDWADLWNGNWRAMGRWEGIENITGTAFADRLYGDNGSNTLNGGAGIDEICGLGGNDVLTGGLGGDVFYFATGFGNDRITDFAAGTAGTDVIRLSIGAAFDSFAEISAAATQVGADTVITFDANTKITLTNVAKTSLAADDFQFS